MDKYFEEIAAMTEEIRLLRAEVTALRELVCEWVRPSETLSIAEKSKILREAHASGDRARIRKANKLINGG
ncbi:MAG TPA: hypothetical protein DDY32_06020 [Desulfobulbaceae bacterium]|nr:hypothetical protein [Desulfobulbaceae bacterium]